MVCAGQGLGFDRGGQHCNMMDSDLPPGSCNSTGHLSTIGYHTLPGRMHHSASTPAGVDGAGGGSRTPPATPKKGGKMLAVRVQMLDDSISMFQIQDDFAYRNNVANADKEIRLGFVRKVYGLLSVQLLATVAIAGTFHLVEPVKVFIHQNDWMVIIAFILSMVTLFALIAKRRDSPANLYLLAAFTVVQAYSVGVVVSYYNTAVVLQALTLTFAVVFSLTVFTLNTKTDFSFIGYGLFAGLMVLIIGGILQLFIQSSGFEIALSFVGAILFSLFLIFDTQMMMTTLSPEEYILATINLYLDIINLFLYILRILNELNRN